MTHCPSTYTDPDPDQSWQMVSAQMIWWGIGLTVIYDTVETVWECPHSMAIALYSSLMIISAWWRVRIMTVVGILFLPVLFASVYFLYCEGIGGDTQGALWTQMVHAKATEYIGWLLLVVGTFLSGQTLSWQAGMKKRCLSGVGIVSLAIGAYMMIDAAVAGMQVSGQSNMTFLIVQQASYFMWLIGVSSNPSVSHQEVSRRRALFVFPRLPVKPTLLLVGTLFFVLYDHFLQHLALGWQYLSMIFPPIAMIFRHKWIRYLSFYV